MRKLITVADLSNLLKDRPVGEIATCAGVNPAGAAVVFLLMRTETGVMSVELLPHQARAMGERLLEHAATAFAEASRRDHERKCPQAGGPVQ